MTDAAHDHSGHSLDTKGKIDWAIAFAVLIPLVVALVDPAQSGPILRFAILSLWHTAPFIAFAVLAVALLTATGSEGLLARAFSGPPLRMIVGAALIGGLAPFCSCEVIPFIAALLAMGAPLAPVMAFWLASPLMDPAMFAITSGTLGLDFAVAKTIAAISIGFAGGLVTLWAAKSSLFTDPLRPGIVKTGCGCGPSSTPATPEWKFWTNPARRAAFAETTKTNGLFLLKWLFLAYLFEGVMVHYVPAGWIAGALGGTGLQPILLGALLGGPAYLNGFAAVPLVSGLLDQGMAPGAAMSFVIAGGISCIPAAIAVWAMVKPRVFFAYIGFAMTGAILAGLGWAAWV